MRDKIRTHCTKSQKSGKSKGHRVVSGDIPPVCTSRGYTFGKIYLSLPLISTLFFGLFLFTLLFNLDGREVHRGLLFFILG